MKQIDEQALQQAICPARYPSMRKRKISVFRTFVSAGLAILGGLTEALC